jgi:hypothetical protein
VRCEVIQCFDDVVRYPDAVAIVNVRGANNASAEQRFQGVIRGRGRDPKSLDDNSTIHDRLLQRESHTAASGGIAANARQFRMPRGPNLVDLRRKDSSIADHTERCGREYTNVWLCVAFPIGGK